MGLEFGARLHDVSASIVLNEKLPLRNFLHVEPHLPRCSVSQIAQLLQSPDVTPPSEHLAGTHPIILKIRFPVRKEASVSTHPPESHVISTWSGAPPFRLQEPVTKTAARCDIPMIGYD